MLMGDAREVIGLGRVHDTHADARREDMMTEFIHMFPYII